MSRPRKRSAAYRARRKLRRAMQHYFIDEPAPTERGGRCTEYRRGVVVGVEVWPAVSETWADEYRGECA